MKTALVHKMGVKGRKINEERWIRCLRCLPELIGLVVGPAFFELTQLSMQHPKNTEAGQVSEDTLNGVCKPLFLHIATANMALGHGAAMGAEQQSRETGVSQTVSQNSLTPECGASI